MTLLALLVVLIGLLAAASAASARQTPSPLESRLSAKIEGPVSLEKGKLPLALTFTHKNEKEQTFQNGEYRFVLLDAEGRQVDNALLIPTVLRKITLKGSETVDRPGLSLAEGKLKQGQRYYVVVWVRNLTALAHFETTK
jgi:hypothetical protein